MNLNRKGKRIVAMILTLVLCVVSLWLGMLAVASAEMAMGPRRVRW